jgi:hypothetical protein
MEMLREGGRHTTPFNDVFESWEAGPPGVDVDVCPGTFSEVGEALLDSIEIRVRERCTARSMIGSTYENVNHVQSVARSSGDDTLFEGT